MRKEYVTVLVLMLLAHTAFAQVRVDSVSMEPSYIEAGDDVEIFVKFHEGLTKREIYTTLTREGERIPLREDSQDYYIAKITPKGQATDRYILVKQGQRNIGHMFAGEIWTSPFRIHVADDAPATVYTLTFEVLRINPEKAQVSETILSEDVNINVRGDPKLTINSDNQLNAGETKQYMVSVKNVGGGTARHTTVNLNATYPLTVLKSSSIYVGDITGKSGKDIGYELYVDSKAEPKAYSIPIELKYTDASGVEHKITDSLGVKVTNPSIISANIDSYDELAQGQSGQVAVSIVNKGFVDAKFLTVEVVDTKDYKVTSNSRIYIGNLASDDFESEEYTLKIADGVAGKIPLKIRVTYTEENNNVEQTKDFNLDMNIVSEVEYKKLHPDADGIQQLITIAIAIPAVIIAYLILWLLLKIMGAITGYVDKKVFRRH